MNNICFALVEEDEIQKLVCAYETSAGEGVYLGTDMKEFREMTAEQQVEKLNTMIIAVTEVINVKRGINFKDYQR